MEMEGSGRCARGLHVILVGSRYAHDCMTLYLMGFGVQHASDAGTIFLAVSICLEVFAIFFWHS